ncbi:hypothetical protein SCHPADRAFT_918858 [Schizopora paradoxa]|uniref:Protein YOP1 n=1 Tax=Schizopora paradoxa TaxID=27342 RepID=A0A0H2S4F2_9AGAM|nr:hypothetical protein SCHPADRAFT_918858 [Schizopora paradoxa]
MFIYLITRIISSTVAFLYPGYASYKTLSQKPASEADLERWLMYWSVLGCIVGVEYVAEWIISWIPFYYTLKTLFLLYLALPQTQGASYLYKYHLQPFLDTHEAEIDAKLLRYKGFAYKYIQDRLRMVWDLILTSMGQAPAARPETAGEQPAVNPGAAPPPTLQDPASGPLQMLGGLWRAYGPAIVATGAAAFQQTSQNTRNAAPGTSFFDMAAAAMQPQSQTADSREAPKRRSSGQSSRERRRQPESDIFSDTASVSSIPVQQGSSSYLPLSGSEADLRARVSQFEEVEVPSDIEGYDVEPTSNRQGKPSSSRRTSWFGWPGASPTSSKKSD